MIRHEWCACDDCDYCQNKAEQKKAERDEPLSGAEEAALDDAYEARYGRH